MNAQEFLNFLRSQRKKLALSITINRDDNDSRLSEFTLIRLKAFLEDPDVIGKQKRFCYIRATEEQKNGPILSKSNCRNAFVSGIRWEKI